MITYAFDIGKQAVAEKKPINHKNSKVRKFIVNVGEARVPHLLLSAHYFHIALTYNSQSTFLI